MKSAQVEVDIRNEQSMVFASHRTTAIGLGLTALGVFIRGSKISPDTSGNYHLARAGPCRADHGRYRWASLIGILLAGFISIGVLQHTRRDTVSTIRRM
jgi:hypothetical protein